MKTRLNEMAIQRKFVDIDKLGLSKDEEKKLLTKIMRTETKWWEFDFIKVYVTLNLILTNNPEFVEEINLAEDYAVFYCCKSEAQHRKLLKMFLSKGIDVNKKARNGDTILHIMARLGYKEEIDLLIKYGANVNALNEYNNTPVFCLIIDPYLLNIDPECVYDCLVLLIDNGANVDSVLFTFLSNNIPDMFKNKYYKMIFDILEVYDNKFDLSRCSSSIKDKYNKLKSI